MTLCTAGYGEGLAGDEGERESERASEGGWLQRTGWVLVVGTTSIRG